MLQTLFVRQVRLIESLTIDFSPDFTVISGETGAGKSVLLEALGLALGDRAGVGCIREEAEQASVAAIFSVHCDHRVWHLLQEQGMAEADGDVRSLILRRVLSRTGVLSRAFINDQSVGLSLLKRVATSLVDIHGQSNRWLSKAGHMAWVDACGHLSKQREKVSQCFGLWRDSQRALEIFQENIAEAQKQEAFLLSALEELECVNPQPDEETSLLERRQQLIHQEKLVEGLTEAYSALAGSGNSVGSIESLSACSRWIQKLSGILEGGVLQNLVQSADRTFAEIEDLKRLLEDALRQVQSSFSSLESLDDRLAQLRSLARKHSVPVSELSLLQERLRLQLGHLTVADEHEKGLIDQVLRNRERYMVEALSLREARKETAGSLEKRVSDELPALKLNRARFVVCITPKDENDYSSEGMESIEFQVSTNPGEVPASLGSVASGGELSRFLMIFKVVLAEYLGVEVLIFDEIDTGTGGAVAEAIGARLKALSQKIQVVSITHAPQVTVYAQSHWKVEKDIMGDSVRAQIGAVCLNSEQQLEEVARMLSGSEITDAARAAAAQLKESSQDA